MSKIAILGLDNKSVGQLSAISTLGYSLGGDASVVPGSSTTIRVPANVYTKQWLDFGRGVIVQPDDLPAYMGLLDTPWSAVKPVTATIYDPEYFFNLRSPEVTGLLKGDLAQIFTQMVGYLNLYEDMYVRMGNVGDIDRTQRTEPLDGRRIWEQLQALALRSGTEFVLRPVKEPDNRWYLYLDIAKSIGVDTDFLVSDGDRGNMRILGATVTGEIINRMIGISSQDTAQSRLIIPALTSDESIREYRMRNKTVQFRDVTDLAALTSNTKNTLDTSSRPYLKLDVEVQNKNHAFRYLRPGNRIMVHGSELVLPRGVLGWRGKCKITKMVFKEPTKSVAMSLVGAIYV